MAAGMASQSAWHCGWPAWAALGAGCTGRQRAGPLPFMNMTHDFFRLQRQLPPGGNALLAMSEEEITRLWGIAIQCWDDAAGARLARLALKPTRVTCKAGIPAGREWKGAQVRQSPGAFTPNPGPIRHRCLAHTVWHPPGSLWPVPHPSPGRREACHGPDFWHIMLLERLRSREVFPPASLAFPLPGALVAQLDRAADF